MTYAYEYDEKGELVRESTNADADGEPDRVLAIEAVEVEDAGKPAKRIYDRGADGDADYEWRYDYDADDRVVRAAIYADAEASDPKSVARYVYDDAGRLESAGMDANADGEVEVSDSFEYDATGRLIRQTSQMAPSGGLEYEPSVYEYRYDCDD